MKKSATPSKIIATNALSISKAVEKEYSHVILHKQGKGFSFTVFWKRGEDHPAEAVATGPKTFKTKNECIKSIKKLYDATPKMLGQGYTCYDYNTHEVDVEIKWDVRKLL